MAAAADSPAIAPAGSSEPMAGANGANGTNGANGVKTNGEKYGESGFASDAEIGMMKLRSRTRASGGGDKSVNGNLDVEELAEAESHLRNDTVTSFAWRGVTVTVKDRKTKEPRNIVDGVDGIVRSGEICALMGPSGCGKTTLLHYLASRPAAAATVSTSGEVLVNGERPSAAAFRDMTCFVEQEDALIGALTVRETLHFSSRLSNGGRSGSMSKKERLLRINALLDAFGLTEQADTLVGTPIRKGISGGQKRRLGVASQLITGPKILFLDEPTSGLDSAASWEVINYLKGVAMRCNLIVIASIHQPSTTTFNLFDQLLLLSAGKPHYFGPVRAAAEHFTSLGYRVPHHINPAEFLLELVNIDFASDKAAARAELAKMQTAWSGSWRAEQLRTDIAALDVGTAGNRPGGDRSMKAIEENHKNHLREKPGPVSVVLTLLHRSFIKSYRDVVVYGIRLAMYLGLAIMMGTVWVRLPAEQKSIIPLINAIFFGSAFMSFMAVAYVPAFLEDRLQFVKEHHNGLYGPSSLIISNFLIGLPYLFIFAIMFSVISYWLSNFQPTATAFFTWVMWVFLDLVAAESLVVFMSSLFPSFVISLALVAFANGLWMSVNGFMVPPTILNAFYKYVFSYWDYQKYVFEGMMVNEFADRSYACGDGCNCMWRTELESECRIAGQGVLDQYGYGPGHMRQDVGIMIAIIAGYRIAAYIVLKLRK